MSEKMPVLLSPKARCAFVTLLQAKSFEDGEAKFSVVLVFDKAAQATPEYKRMEAAADKCAAEKWPAGLPAKFNGPFRPSSEKPEYLPADCTFISISSKLKPQCVDADGTDLFETSELYSGIYGRASLTVYPYDKKGNKGVAFGLNNFQKLGEGEPMSNRPSAASDFGTVSAEDARVDVDAILNA